MNIAAMVALAAQLSGLNSHGQVPKVVWNSQAQIEEASGLRGTIAYYNEGVLHMPKSCRSMTSLWCQSTLLHETTHFLQDINGKEYSCPAGWEALAFEVEQKFLARFDTCRQDIR